MNQIEVFKNNEFGEIRTVIVNDEAIFAKRWKLVILQW